MVAIGHSHVLVLDTSGNVYAKGGNTYGQLGNGNTIDVDIFTQLVSLSSKIIVHIACGSYHSMAIDNTGKVYAWGCCNYYCNYSRQLGDGSCADIYTPTNLTSLEGKTIVSITCGRYHTIALDSNGKVYGWGSNMYDQLGLEGFGSSPQPIELVLLAGKTIVEIACGSYHSIVIDNTGKLYAFGNNMYGQLGIESSDNSIPIEVASLSTKNIINIACGSYHTLALDSTGQVYAWGCNKGDQLGNGNYIDSVVPITPIPLKNKDIVAISSGHGHNIAIDNVGKLYTWGHNGSEQFGNCNTIVCNKNIIQTM